MLPRPLKTVSRLATMTGIGAAFAGCSWLMPSADIRGNLAGSSQPLLGTYHFDDGMKSAQVRLTNANRTLFCVGNMQLKVASIGFWSLRFTPAEFRGELRCDDRSTGEFSFESDDSGGEGLSGTGSGSIGSRAFTFIATKEASMRSAASVRTESSLAGEEAGQSWRRIEELHGVIPRWRPAPEARR